jgi:HPt (histidine-containing phosphotransfer) domain-containing protein
LELSAQAMGESPEPALVEAMNRLWAKFLPQLEERVATLEAAAAALASGALSAGSQREASANAHKLAGVLGTFGLHKGTELAREAEAAYQGELPSHPAAAARLEEIAVQLRALLASRR